jgi:cysteinyl-tRNA synthetase
MAVRYLGQPFDIHTASTDLIFPHGDNEIAIGSGIDGEAFANHWMHSEVVMADGKKVSRATGNDVTLAQAMAEGFDGPTVRYWLLANHYRTKLTYCSRGLAAAGRCVRRLNEFVTRLRHHQSGRHSPELNQLLYRARNSWQDAMDNDLNVPRALGNLFAFIRQTNRLMNDGGLDQDQSQHVLDFLVLTNRILDVLEVDDNPGDAQVERIVSERNQARQHKDFARADALREKLRSMGIDLTDTGQGTRWKKVSCPHKGAEVGD